MLPRLSGSRYPSGRHKNNVFKRVMLGQLKEVDCNSSTALRCCLKRWGLASCRRYWLRSRSLPANLSVQASRAEMRHGQFAGKPLAVLLFLLRRTVTMATVPEAIAVCWQAERGLAVRDFPVPRNEVMVSRLGGLCGITTRLCSGCATDGYSHSRARSSRRRRRFSGCKRNKTAQPWA